MLLATIVLLGAIPQSGELARSVANVASEVSAEAGKDAAGSRSLPSMPTPKAKTDADADGVNSSVAANVAGAAAVQPPRVTLSMQPVKQAYTRPRETRGQRIAWYTLAVTGPGAAAFDAYSTRGGASRGYPPEGNPFFWPFADFQALYGAPRGRPLIFDFFGQRMTVREPP